MNWLKSTFKWCYRIFWYTFVGVIITIAIAISLFRLYLPDVKDYRGEIEAFASEVLDQDVRIKSMEAKLSGITPLIIFDDVYLLDTHTKNEIVHFQQARLTIDLIRSVLKREIVPDSFTVIGVDLGIVRKADGNFTIQGLDFDQIGGQITLTKSEEESDELATWLFKRSKLAIKDSRVILKTSAQEDNAIEFDNVNFYLRNDGDRHQLTGAVTLPEKLGRNLEVAFDFNGNILNPAEWYGKVYYQADDLNLVNWGLKPEFKNVSIRQGLVNVQLWGEWKAGSIDSFTADVEGNDFLVNIGQHKKTTNIKKLKGLVDWTADDIGWKLNLKRFQYQGENELWPDSSVAIRYSKENEVITAHSSFLRLDDIKQALLDGKFLEQSLQERLIKINPGGDLQNVYLNYSFANPYDKLSFASDFKGLTIKPWGHLPGVENITGKVWLDGSKGQLLLESEKSELLIPKLFREDLALSSIRGEINWYRYNKAWHVNANDISAVSDDISADLGLYAMLPEDGSSPYLDLQVSYQDGDAKHTHKYLPVTVMDKELVKWLDQAFMSGTVTGGGVIFNGRLKDFPYRDRSGTLLADFTARDVGLSYQPGWPTLTVNDADLEITGLGLSITSSRAKIYDSQLVNTKVDIDSFDTPYIKATSNYNGLSSDLVKFLVDSPVAPDAKTVVDQTTVSGKATGTGMLQLPLSRKIKKRIPLHYEAKVTLDNSEIDSLQGVLVAKNINGEIKVAPNGVFSDDIRFEILGGHSRAKLYTTNVDRQKNIRMSMHGEIDTAQFANHIDASILDRMSGRTKWQGVVAVGNKEIPGYFQFFSRLKGVELKLPAPLKKFATTEKTFNFSVQFPGDGKLPLNIKYGNELGMKLIINLDTPEQRPINKGEIIFAFSKEGEEFSAEKPRLPDGNELVIRGGLQEFHVDDWLSLINEGIEKKNIGITSLNIPVRLDMEYLKVLTHEQESDSQSERKDPRKIAIFDGNIQTLFINDRHLGHVKFRMDRHEDGLLLKDLVIDAPFMHLEGEGSWLLRDGKHVTNLLTQISTADLGEMLTKLGYSAVMQKGDAKAVIQANWFDTPDNFEMGKLNGSFGIVIENGVLSDVKPGAGRMLGLFSLAELPRRLLLDFSELKQGFAFRQIVGQLDIRDGNAYTDTLKIVSPIALIKIQGRTGLAAQDFDQQVLVVPSVSSTLPVISWIAWGGQIGALAFLLEQLFGEQFDSSIATEYHITGSWDEPLIKKIEKAPPENSPGWESYEVEAD